MANFKMNFSEKLSIGFFLIDKDHEIHPSKLTDKEFLVYALIIDLF